MSIFDGLHGFWSRAHAQRAERANDATDANDENNPRQNPQPEQIQQIHEMAAQVLKLDPALRLAPRASTRLSAALAVALDYADEMARALPSAREASAAAWSRDSCIRAFFAAPDDIAQTLGRSPALRAWFDAHLLARETYALLDMAMSARHVTGMAQQGDAVRADVAQTTLSFDEHQIHVCGASQTDLQQQIVQHVVMQIALGGLAQCDADASRRSELERERALLRTRLQLLEHHASAAHDLRVNSQPANDSPANNSPADNSPANDPPANTAKIAQLRAAIDENDRELARLVTRTSALEHKLDAVCDALSHPDAHIRAKAQHAYLDPMNIVIEEAARAASHTAPVTFLLAWCGADPSGGRALLPIRFARADLPAMPDTVSGNDPPVI